MPEKDEAVETRDFDYDTLVRPLESRMMRSIWRIVRQREAAEDALQDALIIVWKKRGAIGRHPRPEALIIRIAVTAAYDALRGIRRRLRREVHGRAEGLADGAAAPVEAGAEEGEFRRSVLRAIGQLPRRQATAVLLHVIEEMSYRDIARAMGCAESTARVHVLRGRAALARRLDRPPAGRVAPSMPVDREERP